MENCLVHISFYWTHIIITPSFHSWKKKSNLTWIIYSYLRKTILTNGESAYEIPFSLTCRDECQVSDNKATAAAAAAMTTTKPTKSSEFLWASSTFNTVNLLHSVYHPVILFQTTIMKTNRVIKRERNSENLFFISFWLRRTLCFFCTS